MAKLAVIGTREFTNQKLLNDILDLYYLDDPELKIIAGGTSKISQWAEEWAIVNNAEWNTRFEYWHQAEINDDFWLKCHADLLFDADHALVFWDHICMDTPQVFDVAREKKVPFTVIVKDGEHGFYIL
jgi:hypothetical protein